MYPRFLLFLSLLVPVLAQADMTLKYANEARPGEETIIQVKGRDVLMGDQSSKMLFQEGKQEVVIIDHESRTFMVMDEQTADRLGQQMGAAQPQMNATMQQMQEQMRQQMQNMSEAERAQMQQFMRSQMQPGMAKAPVKTTVREQGQDTIAGVTCTKLMVLVNDKPSGDVCVARAGVLGLETKDYNTLVGATDTVRKFMEQMSGNNDNDAVTMNLRAMKGIPVRMRDLVDGGTTTLMSRSSAELDSANFRVPDGYRKRDLMQ